jgi:hypothetical protein
MGHQRGSRLLLAHCARLEVTAAVTRPTARERLEATLGRELTRVLIGALAGDHGLRRSGYLL